MFYPDLQRLPTQLGGSISAWYRVTIRPYRFEPRIVTIGIRAKGDPLVIVDGPFAGLPHRYQFHGIYRGILCMWYPHDPTEARWTQRDGLLALLGHVQTHLIREGYYLEDLRLTGKAEWLGPEVQHVVAEKPTATAEKAE